MLRTLLACLLTTMTLPGAAAAQPAAEQEIRDFVLRVNAAYAANDLPSYWSFYADDLTQWWPTGRVDLPTYKTQWTAFIDGGGRVEAADVSDLLVQIGPGGDVAVASYRLRVVTRSADGSTSEEVNHETDVLFRRDGAWKIVHLHYSPAQP